jgi:crossover junction endodeoxyribonuclease RuvC
MLSTRKRRPPARPAPAGRTLPADAAPDSGAALPADCILGIDPGLQRTGYAFLSAARPDADVRLIEAGVIRIRPAGPLEQRLAELEASLAELLRSRHPRLLACEQLYAHYKHPRTAILMGHARGVILALAARCGISVVSVASTHVKKLLTGRGHAGKLQMQTAVMAQLRLPRLPEPHDVADAIAIAFTGLRQDAARRTLAPRARSSRMSAP